MEESNRIIQDLKGDLETMIKSYDDKLMEINDLKRLIDTKKERIQKLSDD